MNEFSWLYGAAQGEECRVCGCRVRPGWMADHFEYLCRSARSEVGRIYETFAAQAVSDGDPATYRNGDLYRHALFAWNRP